MELKLFKRYIYKISGGERILVIITDISRGHTIKFLREDGYKGNITFHPKFTDVHFEEYVGQ